MSKLQIRISPFFREFLREALAPLERQLDTELAVVPDHGPDEDDELLAEAWREGLREQLSADLAVLRESLSPGEPGQPVTLEPLEAEGLLRAASATRLKIRECYLAGLDGERLETGEVDLHALPPDQQKQYACYAFLAQLQESLVAQLMPDFYEDL